MTHIQILLPFGLPPSAMAADLLRALKMPALATLIARARFSGREVFEDFSRALPHELCLAYQFGLAHPTPNSCSPHLAIATMRAMGLNPEAGTWFIVNPIHIHIARDHLVLTDQRQLTLSTSDSLALFDAAKPYFDEVGKKLIYGDEKNWFVRADAWHTLETATPDAACGHNIDIWEPKGDAVLQWRKLQNEVQMLWHGHRINDERESLGLKPINSLWLWGGAQVSDIFSPPSPVRGINSISASALPALPINHYSATFNLSNWHKAFAQVEGNTDGADASDVIAKAPRHGLLILDQITAAGLAGDWSEWLAQMHKLENDCFAPMLAAIKFGTIDQLSLILTHGTGVSHFLVTKNSLHKFWIKPTLTRLLA